MKYHFFAQQNPDWSLAACLEAVIKLRKIYEPSQLEITTKIGTDDSVTLNRLHLFLKEYALKIGYSNPSSSAQKNKAFIEKWISSADIIACRKLGDSQRHFSLIEQCDETTLTLLDPAQKRKEDSRLIIPHEDLTSSMLAREINGKGFYLIYS